jgi:hypothetical protein
VADKKISELNELAQSEIADADVTPVVDTSATETKKFSWSSIKGALKSYFDTIYEAIISVLPISKGGTGATTASGARTNLLPSQTGNSGKFLKTDGSDVLWDTPPSGGFSSRARAYLSSANQSIPNITWTKVTLNAEDYDGLGEFDSTTNYRFTAQAAGYYLVCAGALFITVPADKECYIAIYKNGTRVSTTQLHSSHSGDVGATVADILYLAAGDYVEFWVYQNSGGDLYIYEGASRTHMAVHRIS